MSAVIRPRPRVSTARTSSSGTSPFNSVGLVIHPDLIRTLRAARERRDVTDFEQHDHVASRNDGSTRSSSKIEGSTCSSASDDNLDEVAAGSRTNICMTPLGNRRILPLVLISMTSSAFIPEELAGEVVDSQTEMSPLGSDVLQLIEVDLLQVVDPEELGGKVHLVSARR